MNKDLVKYALIAVAAYLLYEYVQKNGGIQAILGNALPGAAPPAPGPNPPAPAAGATFTVATAPSSGPVTIDTAGLSVVPDANNSLRGTVKLNGKPLVLAIIQTDGRIFDATGTDVTEMLTKMGVDVNQLRSAFTAAGHAAGLNGFAPAYRLAVWLN